MKKRIAIIYGGEGYERDISIHTAEGILGFLDKENYEIILVFISDDGNWFIKDSIHGTSSIPTYPVRINSVSGFLTDGGIVSVDAAIPALHGNYGEDGKIQGTLESAHIPFVGCDSATGAVACDKIYSKILAEYLGIPTAKWIYAKAGDRPNDVKRLAEEKLGYPMFIKPSTLGSSIGIRVIKSESDFEKGFKEACRYCKRILIEEAVEVQTEIECAVLSTGKKTHILPAGRIFSVGKFYSYERKYVPDCAPRTSHGVQDEYSSLARDYAQKITELLSVRHLSRIDFFIDSKGNVLFNEINTFPGMTPTSLYPLMTEDMGLKRGEFLELLLAEAYDDRCV